jgi:hypothetical protein
MSGLWWFAVNGHRDVGRGQSSQTNGSVVVQL